MTVSTGKWVATRSNVLGTYYRYVLEGSDQTAECFLPLVEADLDDEIERTEAELLMIASWHVFLRNAKLTDRG